MKSIKAKQTNEAVTPPHAFLSYMCLYKYTDRHNTLYVYELVFYEYYCDLSNEILYLPDKVTCQNSYQKFTSH